MKEKKVLITVAVMCVALYILLGIPASRLFTFSDGTVVNGNYVNDRAGFSFLKPDGWTDFQKTKDNGITSFATSDGNGTGVTISIADNTVMAVKDATVFAHSSASDIDPTAKAPIYTTLAGEEYALCYAEKGDITTALYVRLINNKIVMISISAKNESRINVVSEFFIKKGK